MRMLLDIVRQSLSTLWAHKLRLSHHVRNRLGGGSLLLLVGWAKDSAAARKSSLPCSDQNIMFIVSRAHPLQSRAAASGRHTISLTKTTWAVRASSDFVGAFVARSEPRGHTAR